MSKPLSAKSVKVSLIQLLEEVMRDDGFELETRTRAAITIAKLAVETPKRGPRKLPGTASVQ
jgi:hypothetical protein